MVVNDSILNLYICIKHIISLKWWLRVHGTDTSILLFISEKLRTICGMWFKSINLYSANICFHSLWSTNARMPKWKKFDWKDCRFEQHAAGVFAFMASPFLCFFFQIILFLTLISYFQEIFDLIFLQLY